MIRIVAAMTGLGLGLTACGPVTGPPATGAGSSAPNAVEQAKGGNPSGGAQPNTNGNVDPQSVKQSP